MFARVACSWNIWIEEHGLYHATARSVPRRFSGAEVEGITKRCLILKTWAVGDSISWGGVPSFS